MRRDGTEGQYIAGINGVQLASRSFGDTTGSYIPVSPNNMYAPQAAGTDNSLDQTTATFFDAFGTVSSVAAFGASFIDIDGAALDPSSLTIFGTSGQLAQTILPNGGNGSALFRGYVTVNTQTGLAVPAITTARLINGDGYNAPANSDGVVLDDFVFSAPAAVTATAVPEPGALAIFAFGGTVSMMTLLRRRRARL